jgi:hypothetical protein
MNNMILFFALYLWLGSWICQSINTKATPATSVLIRPPQLIRLLCGLPRSPAAAPHALVLGFAACQLAGLVLCIYILLSGQIMSEDNESVRGLIGVIGSIGFGYLSGFIMNRFWPLRP